MSVLRRSFIIAGRHLFYTLSISVIIAMLFIAGIVWLSATVSERKDDIADWVSQQVGYEVSVGRAGLYWLDLFPQLQLEDVKVLQDNGLTTMLAADSLRVELDLLATLDKRSPELRAVDVSGLSTETRRSADNRFTLAGQRPFSQRFELQDVFELLDVITIESSTVLHRDAAYPELNGEYHIQNAILARRDQGWQVQFASKPPAEIAQQLDVQGMLTLTDDNTSLTAAEGELAVQGLQLSSLASLLPSALPVQSNAGEIDAEVEGNWRQGYSEGQLDIALNGLNLHARQSGASLPLEAFTGSLAWQQQAKSWLLQGQQLEIESENGDWPQTTFRAESDRPGQWYLRGNYLQLSDLHAVTELFPDLPDFVADLQAAGDVHDYQLAYEKTSGLQSLTAAVEKLSTAPVRNVPGVSDLSFDIEWQPESADIRLRAQDWQLFAGQWLPETVWFESTSGEVQFRKTVDGWRASATDLRVLNDDLALFVDGSLQAAGEQMHADMSLQLDDVVVSRWLNYLPEKILDPNFLKWSRQAFQGGIIESLTMELDGDLADFPFENTQAGTFSTEMQVRDVTLKYAPDWPALTAIDGSITATGNQLKIEAVRGQTAGFDFASVNVVIAQVFEGKPQLHVDGALNGTTASALAFLQNSPLRSRYGKVTEWLTAEGASDIDLQLTVPLLSPKNTHVSGSVGFSDSQVTLAAAPATPVTQLNGRLNFSNQGIIAQGIEGEFLQRPIRLNIEPVDGRTRITAAGQLPATKMGQLWQGQTPEFVSGQMAFNAEVDVSETAPGEFSVAGSAASELQGLGLALPAPLGKPAEEPRQLTIEFQADNAAQMTLRARLGEVARLTHQPGSPNRTVLALGEAQADLPDAGFTLDLDLAALDLDAWQSWYQQRDASPSATNKFSPDRILAQIDRLTFRKQSFNQFNLEAQHGSGGWLLDIEAQQIAGQVRLPAESSQAINIDLSRLYWQLPERESDAQSEEDVTAPASRASLWPAMTVNIGDLRVDDMQLGTLKLAASREGRGWVLNSASLESDVLQASAEGRWQQFDVDDHSRFEVTLNSDDLAGLLSALQYQPVVEARDVQAELIVEWPADPLGFSRALMGGRMTLSTGRGTLREIEPGAAGRVFGLLSFTAIPRRLSLDFRDLFDEGMAFNSIEGRFDFADGKARSDDLRLRSQSAVIKIQGSVDLVQQTYDQIVQITPRVSSTLPLAGAVAGGPVGLGVGTAIMLADRLVGRVFDRDIVDFISYRYRLRGPWDDPQMQLITSNDE